MIFKLLNNQVPHYLSDKLSFRPSIHNHITRNNNHINIPRCWTATTQRSFFYRAPKLSNSLSHELKQIKFVKLFKSKVKSLIPNLQLNFKLFLLIYDYIFNIYKFYKCLFFQIFHQPRETLY